MKWCGSEKQKRLKGVWRLKEYLILDGYNVINGWPEIRKIAEINLDEARRALIDLMAEYKSFKGIEIIIVFDAYLVKGTKKLKERLKGVEVVYTKERETADSYIERLATELGERNYVSVVTNDWAQQQIVLGSGGARVTVRDLVLDFNAAKGKIHRKSEKLGRINSNSISKNIDGEILRKLEKFRKE